MVEKELGQRNFGFDSLKSILKQDIEEKGIVVVCGTAVSSLRVHFSDAPLFRPFGHLRTPPAPPPPEESAYDRDRNNEASEKRHGPEVNWQLSTKAYLQPGVPRTLNIWVSLSHFVEQNGTWARQLPCRGPGPGCPRAAKPAKRVQMQAWAFPSWHKNAL